MIRPILATLAALAAFPGAAIAHPGHIADLGHGHDHWMICWLGAGVVLALALWTGSRIAAWSKPRKRSRR